VEKTGEKTGDKTGEKTGEKTEYTTGETFFLPSIRKRTQSRQALRQLQT
jgi:hypothetical protein